MRPTLTVVLIAVVVSLSASIPAKAQVPYLQVYFDSRLTQEWGYCPQSSGLVDTLYVGAVNLNMWLSSVEFSVEYPPSSEFVWVGDLPTSPLFLGASPTGIAITWPTPRSAHQPLLLMRAVIVWTCTDCIPYNTPMTVRPHPGTGRISAIRWPDLYNLEPYGFTSLICAITSTEETTWGRIKALYQ